MPDGEHPPEQKLPARTREEELQELTPYQRRIERAARAYYSACERVARGIRTVKGYFEDDED